MGGDVVRTGGLKPFDLVTKVLDFRSESNLYKVSSIAPPLDGLISEGKDYKPSNTILSFIYELPTLWILYNASILLELLILKEDGC